MRISILTLNPGFFAGALGEGMIRIAREKRILDVETVAIRDFTTDRYGTTDDYPYGGGAGMVMKPEPFYEALDDLAPAGPVVLLSARGRPFGHADAVRWSLAEQLTLLCGHYKDVDQRVAERDGVEEVSVGDFVLSGGEFAALCVMDAVVRLLPGALGDHESAATDSHYDGLLSPPSYTRPPEYRGRAVPAELLSGDHARIAAWRRARAEALTKARRPDLWARYEAEHGSDGTP